MGEQLSVDDPALDRLPGLGPKSVSWLVQVGITTTEQLRDVGAVVAYLRIEQAGVRPIRNLLWALHGALEGKPWTEVTPAEKRRLEAELGELRGG